MEQKDLYAILGIERGASEDEIRSSYRKLARKHHPDVNPNDKKAEDRFKEVAFAYDILSDSEKRPRYDEFGMAGLAEGFDPAQARAYTRWSQGAHRSPFQESYGQDLDLDDLLSGFFRGRAGRGGFQARANGPARGRDAHGSLTVEFLDAVRGGEVRLQFEGRNLRVRIPAGAEDGSRIRMAGQGEPGPPGSPAGDLYLTLQVRPHSFFSRRGADLHLELPVTVPELVLGASVEVPTPDDPVTMKIPPHSSNGRILRLRGKGATRRGGDGRGDLYVKLAATLPADQEGPLEELAREMEGLYVDQDPRAPLKGSR
ncbi:MAG: DnaJ C-terminal domain-containing protein [Myxococcota bacterium]